MNSEFVDLSTPPHVAGCSIAPTQADSGSSDEPSSNALPRMINVRERCDVIIAAQTLKDEDDGDAIDDNATPTNESPAKVPQTTDDEDPNAWKNPCSYCGSRYGKYHWERDNGLCGRCSDKHGLSYIDEFHNCWVLQIGESLPPRCRLVRDVYPHWITSPAPHQRALSATRNDYGTDSVKTQAAFRNSWSERRTSASLDREQALRIATMQNQRAFEAARNCSDPHENDSDDRMETQTENADEMSLSSPVEYVGTLLEISSKLSGIHGITDNDASNEHQNEHPDESGHSPERPTQRGTQASSSMSGCVEVYNESGGPSETFTNDTTGKLQFSWFCGNQWP